MAFGFLGAGRPPIQVNETWEPWSAPGVVRDYVFTDPFTTRTSTWYYFAAFAEARYGSPQGLSPQAGQRLLSPTVERSSSMVRWVIFPGTLEARTQGLFVAEARGALHMNPPSFTPFAGTFAGAPGQLVLIP